MTVISNVVNLEERRQARQRHLEGHARCLDCRHEWVAVAPEGSVWLDCPKCTLHRGRFTGGFELSEGQKLWMCNCGNDLFYVQESRSVCANCGTEQRF